MRIGNKEYSHIVIATEEDIVVASITDDEDVIMQNGYKILFYPVEEIPEEMVEVDIGTYEDEPDTKHVLVSKEQCKLNGGIL